jgi:sugar (pentulose or hexulose) kinase
MTPHALGAFLVIAAVVVVIALATSVVLRRVRAKASPKQVYRIHQTCSSAGHAYVAFNAGWRCATCGNHVSRMEGELYGPAEDGRVERRRDPR